MRNIFLTVILVFILMSVGTGCSHHISITPMACDPGIFQLVNSHAGLIIQQNDLNRKIKESSGGGDSYIYEPYKSLKEGMIATFSQFFSSVRYYEGWYQVNNLNDIPIFFLPKIETSSKSTSFLTWPPNEFEVSIDCGIYDSNKELIDRVSGKGFGTAGLEEWKKDGFGAAGSIAMDLAIADLIKHIDFDRLREIAKGSNILE